MRMELFPNGVDDLWGSGKLVILEDDFLTFSTFDFSGKNTF